MKSTEATRAHAQDILDFIHANPEKHDQNWYILSPDSTGCGTSMCIAGTSRFLKLGRSAEDDGWLDTYAAEELGLSLAEAHVIFHDYNNERAVQKLKKIVVGEDFSKEDFYTGEYDSTDEPLTFFQYYHWEQHCANEGLTDAES